MTHQFDLGSKSFVRITTDNRIHLWDVVNGKEKRAYVEKHHLSHSFTCFCWRPGLKDQGRAAVGYNDGVTVIWDFTRGVVVKTIGIVNESAVPTGAILSNDSSSVYISSATQDNIVQFNALSGAVERSLKAGKKGVSHMALNPKAEVLAFSRYDNPLSLLYFRYGAFLQCFPCSTD